MEKEEKAFVEYWFAKENNLYYRQNDGSKMFNAVKKMNFMILDNERIACLHQTMLGKPSKGERYSTKDISTEFEIIEKLDDIYVYSINVNGKELQIECDVYKIKFTR